MEQSTTIKTLLQERKLRITQARQDVLHHIIAADGNAVSSQEIEQQIEGIDRITLYRILKAFEEVGLIHSIADGSGKTKYALCSTSCTDGDHRHDHIHFHCRVCETTTCLEQKIPSTLHLPTNYSIEEMEFVVRGICNQCN